MVRLYVEAEYPELSPEVSPEAMTETTEAPVWTEPEYTEDVAATYIAPEYPVEPVPSVQRNL